MHVRSPSKKISWVLLVSTILSVYVVALVISAFVGWRVAEPHGRPGEGGDPAFTAESGASASGPEPAIPFYSLSPEMDGVMLPESGSAAATAIICSNWRREAEVAVERYFMDTSRYPKDLNELYPAYLDDVVGCPDGIPFYVANNVVVCPLHGIGASPVGR